MTAAIRVEGLGKRYRLNRNAERAGYRTLRESLVDTISAPFRRKKESSTEDFWALDDVSFEVQPGEVVGIIGRNGAGKSTLLKILSRITKPTKGRVEINGRVGSLLEVGTGFHPELTGRENIYLNGSILGMGRKEIERKFDEIVAFAEVEKFLDTPVKRYSSGMYVRLAFAVAAHLEPEILIVDEVLAVGDAGFQKKCVGKMSDLATIGRTILFVSHQMGAVQSLCTHAIMLNNGSVRSAGAKETVIKNYLAEEHTEFVPEEWNTVNVGRSRDRAWFTGFSYKSSEPLAGNHLYPDGPAEFTLEIAAREVIRPLYISLSLLDRFDTPLVKADSVRLPDRFQLREGKNRFRLTIESLHLNPGSYRLSLWLANDIDVLDSVTGAAELTVSGFSRTPELRQPGIMGTVTNRFNLKYD